MRLNFDLKNLLDLPHPNPCRRKGQYVGLECDKFVAIFCSQTFCRQQISTRRYRRQTEMIKIIDINAKFNRIESGYLCVLRE